MDAEKKARLGNRFTCFSCSTHFYDLNKPEPICPKCGADQRDTPPPEVKPKPKRKRAAKKKVARINPALVNEDDGATRSDENIEVGIQPGQELEFGVETD